MSKDYYKVLGVDKNSSQEDIKKAFRKKAHEYHPDKKTGDEAKFKEINEAYQTLGDEKKKSQYDQFGSGYENMRGGQGGGFGGFSGGGFGGVDMDDLGDMFGGFGDMFGFGGGGRRQQSRGADLQMNMTIDFAEAVFGIDKEVRVNKKVTCNHCHGNMAEPGSKVNTCSTCHGSGRVMRVQRTILGNIQMQATCDHCGGTGKTYEKKCTKCHGVGVVNDNVNLKVRIPAGINDGETIKLSGQGAAGEGGTPSGDLYLNITVKRDNRFQRDGYDIHTKIDISFTQAALGGKIEIETVHGVERLKVPAGTQSDTIFKLRGKGVTKLRGSGVGDHFVKVHVKTPTSLSRKQKSLLEELDNG
ncbi:molecular chaperone DnaJ [Candidatus Parcubacteria bacterium]|nr:molecular chaperone DnaJ [Patescibacteria group bacterium]MBU4309021.1 molecular chaperone DnaJ [Patescibacteria group bacterium]MBU4432384.1 molecular chaperone DnaJ [Patescibacteria group bacterium]MBU4577382.1 molecular chaperone DnaJ [Patescibacteria group bacterium]MCG2697070.1 molecular chaperone DnaJ [Candidatus Parcubacteria bacterium]